MVQISITRAIVELKTLDKKIQKLIESSVLVSFKGQFHQPHEGVKDASNVYQSINDLIERRKRIKSAIVTSNALTKIKICGQEMTIAEAIETKSSIKHKKTLVMHMKNQYGTAVSNVERINSKARSDIENKSVLSGTTSQTGSGNGESNKMSLEEFSKTYIQLHGVELFDPIRINQKIEQLESYINQFEQDVDCLLSEKNATTMIDV